MRVLIIATDLRPTTLRRWLWRHGHVVDVVPHGGPGLERTEGDEYDAIIVDARRSGSDSVAFTRQLRAAGCSTPLLVLGARDTGDQHLRSLDAGADDYLTAPFSFEELEARLRAITRRGQHPLQDSQLVVGDLVLDRRTRVVMRGTRVLTLAPKEFALLDYLMRHPGQVITRAMLLAHVWDYDFDPRSNAVDAAIKRLRKAVDAGEDHPMIQTVRGVGYKLQA